MTDDTLLPFDSGVKGMRVAWSPRLGSILTGGTPATVADGLKDVIDRAASRSKDLSAANAVRSCRVAIGGELPRKQDDSPPSQDDAVPSVILGC
jgi:hypothetical protein